MLKLPLCPQVVLPNDPDLVDTLARNGVDISVAEAEQQGSLVGLLGNLIFPLIAFAGLFFLFRRGGDQSGNPGGGGMGGMGGALPSPLTPPNLSHQPIPLARYPGLIPWLNTVAALSCASFRYC